MGLLGNPSTEGLGAALAERLSRTCSDDGHNRDADALSRTQGALTRVGRTPSRCPGAALADRRLDPVL